MMLLGKNATVTICHTKTRDVQAVAREADILVSAAGVLKSLTKDYVRPGQIVIDVSMNWDPDKVTSKGKGGMAATPCSPRWSLSWRPSPPCPAVWAL